MKWIFNSTMIWGAVLGAVIAMSYSRLVSTARHKGPGYVYYGDPGPERSEKVSEQEYKRHNFVSYGLVLCLGVTVWVIVAWEEKKKKSPNQSLQRTASSGRGSS